MNSDLISYDVTYSDDKLVAEDKDLYLDLKNSDDEIFSELYENGKIVVNEEKTSYKTLAFDIALSDEYTFDVGVYNINDESELGSKEFNINIDLVGEGNINNEYEAESVRTFTIKVGEKINIWPSGIYTYCWPSDEGES